MDTRAGVAGRLSLVLLPLDPTQAWLSSLLFKNSVCLVFVIGKFFIEIVLSLIYL